MGPSAAALTVEQPGRGERVTDAARQGVEPLIVEVDDGAPERASSDRSASVVARAVKHVAEADNPSAAELIVATDLAAASKARTVRREFTAREVHAGVTKGSADVGADVAPGPGDRWRRRRDVGGRLAWQVSRRSLTRSQTNNGGEQHQRVFSHSRFSPNRACAQSGARCVCPYECFNAAKVRGILHPRIG